MKEPIVFVGDPHGDASFIDYVAWRAVKQNVEKIVLLGDVGFYWPDWEEFTTRYVPGTAKKYDVDIYGIDGNHDNHAMLRHDASDFVEVGERFYYIPRGHSWTWGESKFLGIGGAYSVDKDARVPYVDWWPNEMPDEDDVERAVEVGPVDIVVAHEFPLPTMWALPWTLNEGSRGGRGQEANTMSRLVRHRLNAVWESSQCHDWIHGHHHKYYTDIIENRRITGLDCNSTPSKAWAIKEV